MACLKTSAGNGGPGIGPTYATEAACLEACKEGACCETANGVTTCSVKPACQCQGTGKTFKGVGTTCSQYNGACCDGASCSIKPECECVGDGKLFRGVGTTCAQGTCLCCDAFGQPRPGQCAWCWCFCGDGAAPYPRFINATLSGWYLVYQPILQNGVQIGLRSKQKSINATVTLSAFSQPSRFNCPNWHYGLPGRQGSLPIGNGVIGSATIALHGTTQLDPPNASNVNWSFNFTLIDDTEFSSYADPNSWWSCLSNGVVCQTPAISTSFVNISGPYTSGVCLSGMVGQSHVSGENSGISVTLSVNGVQP